MMLGKLPPKLDPRTRSLATVEHLLPGAPGESDWSKNLVDLGPMLNDTTSDCTAAGLAHGVQTWTAANGVQITPADVEVLAFYIGISGYDPKDPMTDRGAYMIDALNRMRAVGLGGHKIDRYARLTLKNREHFKQGVHYYGGVYAGLWLPRSAKNQEKWHIALGGTQGDPSVSSWGGHAVFIVGYNAYGVLLITWGRLMWASWSFLDTYCDEAYVCSSSMWADADGAPSGLAYAVLDQAMPEVAA